MANLNEQRIGKKWPRTEDRDGCVEVSVVESEELWLQDGSIIIRTTSHDLPQVHTLYKIHKYVLSLHCAFFSSLFDGPVGALDAGSEQHDGCPIMDLPDDPEDVRNFLMALYFPAETHLHVAALCADRQDVESGDLFPQSYFGILRLAHKYEASSIRKLVVEALEAQWPSELDDWTDMREDRGRLQLWKRVKPLPLPDKVIRLAFDCNVPSVLPAAFYDLACIIDANAQSGSKELRQAELTLLSADELSKLLRGKAAIRGHLIRLIEDTAQNQRGWPGCDPEICRPSAFEQYWYLECASALSDASLLSWFSHCVEGLDFDDASGPCKNCKIKLEAHLLRSRADLWKGLSS
ncbi:hypothetical protein BV25DRAFT_1903501, partial [Artomyces pyxidatus]